MQEHVKLEVSLEIIMARIAQAIFNLDNSEELHKLIDVGEEAYKGNRQAVEKILNDKE